MKYCQTLDVDNLISVCTKKLQEDPAHKKALFIRSSSFLKKGRFAEAIQDCNQLMKLDQTNAGAYYIRGCAFEKLGQIDQSIEDFTTVLEIDPNHINAAYARGACENKRGNFAKAIDDYNMALEKDQERPLSPGGSRKIKFRNMKYILDMPMVGFNSNSYNNSASKKGDEALANFNSTGSSGKVLNQINNNLPPRQNSGNDYGKNGMLYTLQESPGHGNYQNKHQTLLSPGSTTQNRAGDHIR